MANKETYPPLEILKEISREMPKVWDMIDTLAPMARKMYGYSERIFAPVEVATAASIKSQSSKLKDDEINIPIPSVTLALAQWRKDKEVFTIDPDLCEVLCEQDDDLVPPIAALDYLPYPCFYVETSWPNEAFDRLHGFFFYFGWDTKKKSELLSFVFLGKDKGVFYFDIPVNGDSLEKCFDDNIRRLLLSKNQDVVKYGKIEYQKKDFTIKLLKCSLQIILYLCACNAEIIPDESQKRIKKQNFSIIKDRYAEIRKWDVGFRTGAAIRAQKINPDNEGAYSRTSEHTSKRPHMRRAHWHHFWTGSKSNPNERKLILKWLPPIAVSMDADGAPVVFHEVKR